MQPVQPPDDSPQSWIDWLKTNWNIWASLGAWLIAIISAMLFPLGTLLFSGDQQADGRMLAFATFIVVVLIALTFLVTKSLNKKSHYLIWAVLTLLFFGSSIFVIMKQYSLQFPGEVICYCNTEKIIKGTAYKYPERMRSKYGDKGVDCTTFCNDYKNIETGKYEPGAVWTEDSINGNRNLLLIIYLLSFPLTALSIVSVLQTVYCYLKSD